MVVVSGLSKIYEIGPFWRAETIQSYRHLQESISLDVEFSQPKNLEEIYMLAYSIILDVKKYVWKNYKIKNKNLILPEVNSVPVITYTEAINMLNSKGYTISLGEDLGLIGEANLGQIIKRERGSDVFIVRDYPDTIKKFYTKKKESGLTETFDIILAGWELVSGAIRETDRAIIEKSMHLSGIDANNYSFYLSIIDGSISHGGFGLGVDRLIAKLLDLEMVSDAVVFPRTFKNLIP
jgi:aspartyl/asparaginyl-tRNA synthetase